MSASQHFSYQRAGVSFGVSRPTNRREDGGGALAPAPHAVSLPRGPPGRRFQTFGRTTRRVEYPYHPPLGRDFRAPVLRFAPPETPAKVATWHIKDTPFGVYAWVLLGTTI